MRFAAPSHWSSCGLMEHSGRIYRREGPHNVIVELSSEKSHLVSSRSEVAFLRGLTWSCSASIAYERTAVSLVTMKWERAWVHAS